MASGNPVAIVRRASTVSILWGACLIVLGLVAIAAPMAAAAAVNVFISWLLVLAGAVHLAVAFHLREAGRVIWRALVGLAYIGFGVYLITHPAIGVASLTLVLASLFLLEGIFDITLFFQARGYKRSTWILLDGIVTLLLGLLIYLQWPSSSAWAIGTLVGVSMIISGVTRLMVSVAVRKATDSVLPRAA
ncbi:MAG TPA: DUF308 domain-containing protein [Candidatus Sulfotelmatobacter sp.]|nr:DUF308 domain-containing protein [Candidatus Sulfotelmatobacter sp.]